MVIYNWWVNPKVGSASCVCVRKTVADYVGVKSSLGRSMLVNVSKCD